MIKKGRKDVTPSDLEALLQNMDYAIVAQSKTKEGNVNLFVKVDGTSLSTDVPSAWTVESYRSLKKGKPNGIIYDCGEDGVELVVRYPNGYGISAISTPRIPSGRHSMEVAIKCGSNIVYDTAVADDFIEHVSLEELPNIMKHVRNLSKTGWGYIEGFAPDSKYNNKSLIQEVYKWYKTGKRLLK